MTLVADLDPVVVRRLDRYRALPGGFGSMAAVLLANLHRRPDGSAFVVLTSWDHIRRFVRQRREGIGGWQRFLRGLSVCLRCGDGPVLTQWPDIATVIAERERGNEQLNLLAS